jgi:hypothetical protein
MGWPPDTVAMSLPAALNALRAGTIEPPTDSPSTLTGLTFDAVPVRKIPQPPRRPAWQQELDAAVAETERQRAADAAELRIRIIAKRQELQNSAISSTDVREATADAQRRHQIARRLDEAEAQLGER